MKPTMFLLLFSLTFVSYETFAQNIDTVNIYKSKARAKEKYYYRHWFWTDKGYSMNGKRNSQDSLVMYPTKISYFKYYTRPNGRLILEGKNSPLIESYFDGEVKIYYRNGRIKRIENWGIRKRDACGLILSLNDAPEPKETWKYFDKNGHLTQTDFYHIDILSCKPLSYKLVLTSNYYNAASLITKTTNNILQSYTFDK